jgi:hypothetical protein
MFNPQDCFHYRFVFGNTCTSVLIRIAGISVYGPGKYTVHEGSANGGLWG